MSTLETQTTASRDSHLTGRCKFNTTSKAIEVSDGLNWLVYDNDGAALPVITNSHSLFLDGTDDHAEVTGSSDIQISNPLTVSAWIYPTSTASPSEWRTIISWGSASGGRGRFLQLSGTSNNLTFGTYQSSVTSSTSLSLNTWYHVAATVTSGETKLYIDGSLDTTGSNTLNSFTYSKTHVGELYYSQTTAARHFAGNIDELALFNSVLTADEVSQLYNFGNPFDLNSDAGNYTSSANLKAWWRMGDGTENGLGSTIHDMSTNGSSADDLALVNQASIDDSNAV